MTDEELKGVLPDIPSALEIITTLRAQLAEADALIEAQAKDHASNNIRLAETSYRAERAEAALAAQNEVGPVAWVIPGDDNEDCNGFIDAMAYEDGEFTRPLYAAQPHDRTALDRYREKVLREAADELRGQGYGNAVRIILALIEKPNAS